MTPTPPALHFLNLNKNRLTMREWGGVALLVTGIIITEVPTLLVKNSAGGPNILHAVRGEETLHADADVVDGSFSKLGIMYESLPLPQVIAMIHSDES